MSYRVPLVVFLAEPSFPLPLRSLRSSVTRGPSVRPSVSMRRNINFRVLRSCASSRRGRGDCLESGSDVTGERQTARETHSPKGEGRERDKQIRRDSAASEISINSTLLRARGHPHPEQRNEIAALLLSPLPPIRLWRPKTVENYVRKANVAHTITRRRTREMAKVITVMDAAAGRKPNDGR